MKSLRLTSQFPHCGNAFSCDTYRGCEFGCRYCFAQARNGNVGSTPQAGTTQNMPDCELKRMEGFFAGKQDKSLISELCAHRVPIHLGGMCDPFTSGDPLGITTRFLKAARSYPVMVSTKTATLPGGAWDAIVPGYHAFQLSITGFPDEAIRMFETNTPTTEQRCAFAAELKRRGVSVFIRIQPLVCIDWAVEIVRKMGRIVDGFTIEHLKLPADNIPRYRELCAAMVKVGVHGSLVPDGREFVFNSGAKIKNIETLKAIPRTAKINVGDNDLRLMSETNNCCGLTLCPSSFSGWIKHNSMAMQMGCGDGEWHPNADGRRIGLNSTCIHNGWGYADYVHANRVKQYGDPNQMELAI